MDRASWSDPPEFLMIEIVNHIDSHFDILRIRSVCSLWRLSVPSPFLCKMSSFLAELPWPMPWEDSDNPEQDEGYCLLKETIICRLEKIADTVNSPGWLVMIEDGMSSIISSPKLSILPYPKVLNLMDFRITEISKVYDLQFVDSNSFPVTSPAKDDSVDVIKIVVSSLDDFAIFVLHYSGRLGFLRLGDEKWTLANAVLDYYDDIVSYKGKIYAVDYDGKLKMFDSSGSLTEITCHVHYVDRYRLHLVESFGNLLLVEKLLKYNYNMDDYGPAYEFEVYKLDEQEQCWVKVSSLEDIALFVSNQCSFSVKAEDFRGNCIYFRDLDGPVKIYEERTFIYDLTNGNIESVKSFPCPSNISWPPQKWY